MAGRLDLVHYWLVPQHLSRCTTQDVGSGGDIAACAECWIWHDSAGRARRMLDLALALPHAQDVGSCAMPNRQYFCMKSKEMETYDAVG
jgi:hypothetical protein